MECKVNASSSIAVINRIKNDEQSKDITKVFRKGNDWQNNACLNFNDPQYSYSLGYREAANFLAINAADHHMQDLFIYPIAFLYRHHLELQLKLIIETGKGRLNISDGDQNKLQDEIGDLLHAVFSLCVFNGLNPHDTLTRSVEKFERRFNAVQQLAIEDGLSTLQGKSFDDLMTYWDKAKCLT